MLVSVQVPLHSIRPVWQEQLPFRHDLPREHAFPHEPQLSRSMLVSVQVPLQRVRPSAQAELSVELVRLSTSTQFNDINSIKKLYN